MFSIGRSTYRDLRQLQRALGTAQREFPALWIKALNDAADIALKYFLRQFHSQGAEFGQRWQPLKSATMKDRQRKGYKPAQPILVRRGWLRASVTSKTSTNAKREVTQGGIKLYSTLKTKSGHNLLMIHHSGVPSRKIPPRPIYKEGMWISETGWNEIKTRFLGMFIELRRKMER